VSMLTEWSVPDVILADIQVRWLWISIVDLNDSMHMHEAWPVDTCRLCWRMVQRVTAS
jgi:hypothetical protein